jgi:hypothetical protein
MSEKEDLLAKYKLWAFAREKGEITNQDKPKRTRASRGSQGKKDDKKTDDKDNAAGASPEDGDDEKKHRTSRGGRKNRKEDSSRHSPKEDPKLEERPEGKVEPSKSGPLLDEQMGLQDIACGLKVGPDGGYAVVESHETVEDDSGFTTEVGKKEKKAQMREEAQQKEKAARRQRLKEAAKAKQQDKEKAKADATKSKSEAKPTPEGSGASSGGSPQGNLATFPAPIASEFRGPAIQDLGAQPGPAKQAWGPKPAENEKTDFTSIMLDQKYKQTFPEQRMPFEVPAPKDPVPGGSAPVGAERLERKLSGSAHDIWANNSTTPSGAGFNTNPFDPGVGSAGFSGPNFNGGLITLTPATAQFTALPSFASNAFTNTFSAAPGVSDGWGNSETVPGPSPFVQQQLGPTDSSAVNPAGWASQKPVGASRNDTATNGRASSGKGGAPGEKQNRKSRGGKGRGGKDNKGGKDNGTSKNKDGNPAKADQGQQAKATRGGRQNRRPPNGGKSGAKSGTGSADKPIAPVDAVIPAKSGNRRGGRHAKKGNHASSDKN